MRLREIPVFPSSFRLYWIGFWTFCSLHWLRGESSCVAYAGGWVRCCESLGEECFSPDCLCWLMLFNAKCWKYCCFTPTSDGFCSRNVGFVEVVQGKNQVAAERSSAFDVQWKLQELLDTIFRLFLQFSSFHWNKTKLCFFLFFPREDNTSAVSKYTSETVAQEMLQTEAVMEGEEGHGMH